MKNIFLILSLAFLNASSLFAQPEVYPWSNISGIRLDGELMELNSTLGFVGADWSTIRKTAKERIPKLIFKILETLFKIL